MRRRPGAAAPSKRQASDERQGARLFQELYAALVLPRDEKVVVDFAGVRKVAGEFLAAGLTALMGPFKGSDLAANLEIVNLDKVYLALLQKINDLYRAKAKEIEALAGLCREAEF